MWMILTVGAHLFGAYAYSRRISPLEFFIVFELKTIKIPTGKRDGYTRMLQMNAPLVLLFLGTYTGQCGRFDRTD